MRGFKSIVGIAVVMTAGIGGAGAATYANARYGFAVTYPSGDLIPQPEADDGDGRAFTDPAGRASFKVYASLADEDTSPARIELVAEEVCGGAVPAYRLVKPRVVAMACLQAGTIFYQKTLLADGRQTTLTAAYPAGERHRWDPILAHMAVSLTPAMR